MMSRALRWTAGWLLAVLVIVSPPERLLGSFTFAPASSRAPVDARVARLTQALDAFDARDLGGARWTRRDLRGRVVLIDFWATWCASCLAELPALRRLRETHGSARFEILAVNLDVLARRDLVGWLRRNDVTWPQIADGRGYGSPLAHAFDVRSLPSSLLLDRDGRITAVNLRGKALADAVDRLVYSVD